MSTVTTQDDSVLWGDLQLHGPLPIDATYEIKTMSEGTNFGNPTSIIEQVQSMAIDGALAARTGWDARTFPVRIRLAANDGETLAQVEQALTAQVLLDRPPPIEWTPPLGSSAPAVFDVLVADLQRDTDDGWDHSEKFSGHRFYVLTLTCLPFARAMDTVVVPAIAPPPDPGTPSTTLIDECASLTGWTVETNGWPPGIALASGGSGVQVTANLDQGTDFLRAARSGATAMPAGQPYLAVDLTATSADPHGTSWNGPVWAVFDGIYYAPVGIMSGKGESGSTRYFFEPPSSWSTVTFAMDYKNAYTVSPAKTFTTTVYKLQATDTLGDVTTSTARQQSRLTTITGAMPTRATIRLSGDVPVVLGSDVIVYTSSNTAWTPPLRTWLDSSSLVTADSDRVSGGRNTLATPSVFKIPANLLEDGAYSLAALISCASDATLTWEAQMITATGDPTVLPNLTQSGQVTIPATTDYQVFDVADSLMLPPFEVETNDFVVELTLTGTSGMVLDEAWLFCLDNGALTSLSGVASDPDAAHVDWLEIRSPELGAARPSVFGGTGDVGEMSVCLDSNTVAFGPHRFEPGPLLVFTMCTNSLTTMCEVEYFPRFHSHPAADQSDPDPSDE